jgi:hypothetical protein
MHNGFKVVLDIYKVFSSFTNIKELLLKTLQIPEIVISFYPSLSNLILDLVKWFSIGTFIIF